MSKSFSKKAPPKKTVKPHWLLKSVAGTVLGLSLAIAIAGLFYLLAPAGPGKIQMAMWIVSPIWLTAVSAVFLFRDGMRASLWLGAANAAAYAILLSLPTKAIG